MTCPATWKRELLDGIGGARRAFPGMDADWAVSGSMM